MALAGLVALLVLHAWTGAALPREGSPPDPHRESGIHVDGPMAQVDIPQRVELEPEWHPAPRAASVSVRLVSECDGGLTVSSGLDIELCGEGEGEPRRQTSGPLGWACWEDLEDGWYVLRLPGVANASTFVQPGEDQRFDWRLPCLGSVEGLVIDTSRMPVEDCAIWISSDGGHSEGRVVMRTGADGRFEVTMPRETVRWLGAHKDGFDQVPLRPVVAVQGVRASDEPDLVVVLEASGMRLEGTVTCEGRGITGAAVELLPDPAVQRTGHGELLTKSVFHPRQVSTDGSGQFQFEGVPDTSLTLRVRGEGYGVSTTQVPAGTDRVHIELEPCGRVVGRVVDSQGRSVEGATVCLGSPGRPFCQSVSTDSDGGFVCDAFSSGTQPLWVERGLEREASPVLQVRVVGGEEVDVGEIEVKLVSLVPLHGRVVPARSPLGSPWTVRFRAAGKVQTATCGQDGRFRSRGLPPSATDIAYTLLHGGSSVAGEGECKVPTDGDLGVIHADPARLEVVEVRGRLLSARGAAAGYLVSAFSGTRPSSLRSLTGADGAFSVRLPAQGPWWLRLDAGDGECVASRWLGWIEGLDAIDLGDIVLGTKGRLLLERSLASGHASEVTLRREGGELVLSRALEGLEPIALHPGRYTVEYSAPEGLCVVPVVIESGRTARLSLPARSGGEGLLRLVVGGSRRPVRVEIAGQDLVHCGPARLDANGEAAWVLPAGRYELVVMDGDRAAVQQAEVLPGGSTVLVAGF